MIIDKLKKAGVTSFSEVVAKFDHGTKVCVGGQVTNVMDMTEFASEEQIQEGIDLGVYITLDDMVGFNHLVVPKHIYDVFKADKETIVGELILAVGKILKLEFNGIEETTKRPYKVKNHPEQTTRVAAYFIGYLPEEK